MTINKDISIKDINFNAELIGQYSLNFCISDHEISHIVYDKSENKFLAMERHLSMEENLIPYLENHVYLAGRFWNEINVCFTSNRFSLIPNSLFDKSMVKNYLQLNGIESQEYNVDSTPLTPTKITDCFAFKKAKHEQLRDFYQKEIKTTHHTASFVKSINNYNLPIELHLLFQQNNLSLVVKENSKIKYINVFEPQTSEDSVFYTLMIIKKLNLSQNTPTYLYGDINNTSSETIRLKEFLTNIHFAVRTVDHRFSFAFDELEDHNFPHLFKTFDTIHYE